MIPALVKTSEEVQLGQIPGVLRQLKGAIEIFFAMRLQETDNPIADLNIGNGDIEHLYEELVATEEAQGSWVTERYEKREDVPQAFLPYWDKAKGIQSKERG
jgi:hypothetical protein